MKRIATFLCALLFAAGAFAQTSAGAFWEKDVPVYETTINAFRLEGGVTLGQAGSFTPYADFGMGAYVLYNGIYVDFIGSDPQHRYSNETSDTDWNDSKAFCINAGYQIPLLKWLRVMPLAGYCQTNEGVTEAGSFEVDVDEDGADWYHDYTVTPGSRIHRFNFGGGLSIQPCKWFSINFIATRYAIYGGIGIDIVSYIRYKS